ncbi:hypothetical protein TanjilG_24595 [Lupinus angustifolius]|uniref:Transcription repressor n=1 Tax=Lupinus angustifolius TaxID=3871 RepID=A0A4P1RKB2_LUPAN|nr:PREDICTED: transcription repressor OFP12-like [Lupinus angustifolius]OIW12662.1 hypothetical protein TanjilG_24595 [Lupinus angustifolius]
MFKHCFSKFNAAESESTTNPTATINTTSSHNDYDENPPCPTSPLMKNFNSLYEHEPEAMTADLATALASQRFFFSSPGHSNSLIEYTTSSSLVGENNNKNKNKKKKKVLLFKESVAVPTYSSDPYLDFRRSMQEMVEARPELMDVNTNWNVLHQLLLSYLALNPKTTHKFILTAFSDLLISLMSVQVS